MNPSTTTRKSYIDLCENAEGKFDAIVLAVSHNDYQQMNNEAFEKMMMREAFIMDVKGILKNWNDDENYFSL